jgi:hypothetical protein
MKRVINSFLVIVFCVCACNTVHYVAVTPQIDINAHVPIEVKLLDSAQAHPVYFKPSRMPKDLLPADRDELFSIIGRLPMLKRYRVHMVHKRESKIDIYVDDRLLSFEKTKGWNVIKIMYVTP